MDVEELDAALSYQFDLISQWHNRVRETPKEVQPGSELALDDASLDPFQLSHGAQQCLLVAVDHLHALRTLVVDARWLHAYAPFALIRAGLENASAAVWLLGPDDSTERRLRRLRHALADAKDARAVYLLIDEDVTWIDEREALVGRIAGPLGLTAAQLGTRQPGYETIVVAAQEYLGSKGPQLAYKGMSGLNHGRPWAALGLLQREQCGSPDEGSQTVGFNADLATVHNALSAAVAMTQLAFKLYDRRRLRWIVSG